MILATSKIIVQDENWRNLLETIRQRDLLETMKEMIGPARRERGCLSYRLYEDVENRNAFVLMEEWATQKDLERHICTDNKRLLLALMDLLSSQPELCFNIVSGTAGIDLIENALLRDLAKGTSDIP